MGIAASIMFLIMLIVILKRYYSEETVNRYVLPAVFLKITAGIAMGLIYSHYYLGGDTHQYFNDAVALRELAINNTGDFLNYIFKNQVPNYIQLNYPLDEPRAFLFSKICAIINIISFDSYYLLSTYLSLFSVTGFIYLANQTIKAFPRYKNEAVIAFLAFPSVVFWSSGVIKETIAVGTLAFIFGLIIKYFISENNTKIKFLDILLFIACILLSWFLKYYFIGILIATFLPTILFSKLNSRVKKNQKWILWSALFLITIGVVTLTRYNFQLNNIPNVVFENAEAFVNKSNQGDYIQYPSKSNAWTSILINSPIALFSGLFRPSLFEVDSIFKLVSAIENSLLFIFLIISLSTIPKILKSKYKFWIISGLSYIIILAIFLALSTPNFGTLVRYKSGFLFVFVFLTLIENPLISKIKKAVSIWKNQ